MPYWKLLFWGSLVSITCHVSFVIKWQIIEWEMDMPKIVLVYFS